MLDTALPQLLLLKHVLTGKCARERPCLMLHVAGQHNEMDWKKVAHMHPEDARQRVLEISADFK